MNALGSSGVYLEAVTQTLALAPDASSVRHGRQFVASVLDEWGMGELAETAVLLTSELLTNSVLHARTDIALTVQRRDDSSVDICVHDGSRHTPRRRRHAHDATTGRGIELLERLAQEWEVTTDEGGKTIRFTVGLGTDPWAAFADAAFLEAEL